MTMHSLCICFHVHKYKGGLVNSVEVAEGQLGQSALGLSLLKVQ